MSKANSPRCRSRSALRRPARAPIPRPPAQGLLFMAEAVYNASGLGLPIVMTLGNRAIGAPINIWNDHSDAMSMRDAGWLQLFAETNQEVDRPAHPGVPAGRGIVDAGDGLRRRLYPDARGRAHRHPHASDVDAYPAALRSGAGARSHGAHLDRRHGRAGRFHRSAFPRPLQADPGIEADSGIFRRIRRRDSAAIPAGCCAAIAPTMPTCWWSRWVRSAAPSRTPSTRCGTTASASASSSSCRSGRSRSRRCATRWPAPRTSWWSRRAFAVGMGGQLANNVDVALRNLPRPPRLHSSVAGLGGRSDHARLVASPVPAGQRAAVGRHQFPRPERTRSSAARFIRTRKTRRSGPTAENILRELAKSAQPPAAE